MKETNLRNKKVRMIRNLCLKLKNRNLNLKLKNRNLNLKFKNRNKIKRTKMISKLVISKVKPHDECESKVDS
jgi:hypothetical protein